MSCPHCGYCEHCGRSNRQFGQWPYYQPYPYYWVKNGDNIQAAPNTTYTSGYMQQLKDAFTSECNHDKDPK